MSESNPNAYQVWQSPNFEDGAERMTPPPEDSGETEGESSGKFVPVLAQIDAGPGGGDFEEGPSADAGAPGSEAEPDFAAMKFLRENTLLSNAEKYAASIQEEAELYVARIRDEVETLNREAEARYEEARLTKEQAEKDAEELISSAQAETDRIRNEAYQEGLNSGTDEAMQKRYDEAAPYLERIESILTELGNYRRQVAYYAEKDAVRLAVLMAKQVLRQELKLNRKAVWNLLARTLSTLQGQGQFRVWLNPQDYEFAQTARPALEKFIDEDQSITFRGKPDIPPGNVQIETDREVIDLTFQNQFHYLEGVLNQALAERETVVTQRPPSADPPIPIDESAGAPAAGATGVGGPQAESVPEPGASMEPATEPAPGEAGDGDPR